MRDLAFNFDAPPEAQHVSSELTQAKLDEFRQMPWIEPDLKQTTLEGLQVVERYWRRYSPSGSAPPVWICLWATLFLTLEAGTAATSTSTTGTPCSARNAPCT